MGSSTSVVVEEEKATWKKPHNLEVDEDLQEKQRPFIADFGKDLTLCWLAHTLQGKRVRHYFVTDGTLMMEFGDGRKVTGSVEVKPLSYKAGSYEVEKEFQFTKEVRQRMEVVCGSQNHSFCLRNSEHMCKYIITGSWVSRQVFPEGLIMSAFRSYMGGKPPVEINTLPVDLKPEVVMKTLYTGMTGFIKYRRAKTPLTEREASEAFNVVLLGPTGCGKSNLINVLYNKTVCPSVASLSSVTRNMRITQGTTTVLGRQRPVNVIDTIGFCDSEMSPSEVMASVQQHLKANFFEIDKIVLVCAGRLEAEQEAAMRQIMDWLRYSEGQNRFNFVLVYNKCDGLDETQREELLAQMCGRLKLATSSLLVSPTPCLPSTTLKGQTQNRITDLPLQVAVGFPPNASYASVTEDHLAYLDAVFHTHGGRLKVDPASGCAVL
uniref:AIG1-type G domain-containing protein n=1 Tax=Alexandrium monilatum TaxID=311494 RepID=A0A7S4QBB8_9DINO|mmetsp:Transcript_70885/g.211343  ORF Transcript_70885/g.211343 Transcript_70885/m.211343 type:complete len:435 (+) Transcript_70885:46-1350(+)